MCVAVSMVIIISCVNKILGILYKKADCFLEAISFSLLGSVHIINQGKIANPEVTIAVVNIKSIARLFCFMSHSPLHIKYMRSAWDVVPH